MNNEEKVQEIIKSHQEEYGHSGKRTTQQQQALHQIKLQELNIIMLANVLDQLNVIDDTLEDIKRPMLSY